MRKIRFTEEQIIGILQKYSAWRRSWSFSELWIDQSLGQATAQPQCDGTHVPNDFAHQWHNYTQTLQIHET